MSDAASVRLVLASQSPRRRELLTQAGLSFEVRPSAIDESPRPAEKPRDYVLRMAKEKAAAAERREGETVLAADTTVVLGDLILGKPENREEAFSMIRSLGGRKHVVMTAFSVIGPAGDAQTDVVLTEVSFRELTDEEINAFLDLDDYKDKAGGYGIQSTGAGLTDRIRGSYTNVVGLPVAEVLAAVREAK